MAGVQLLLLQCLYIATVIQMTSSQSTYDITEQENDVSSCGRTEQTCGQLITAISHLQREIAELKTANQHKDVKGMPTGRWKSNTVDNTVTQENREFFITFLMP